MLSDGNRAASWSATAPMPAAGRQLTPALTLKPYLDPIRYPCISPDPPVRTLSGSSRAASWSATALMPAAGRQSILALT